MSEYEATPSHVHRQRGRCCKQTCLHCPYGHTISTLGFSIYEVELDSFSEVQECLELNQPSGVAAMLLSQAYKPKKTHGLSRKNMNLFKRVYLKEHFCGCLYLNGDDKKLYLMPKFQDQNIVLEDVLIYIP